MKSLLGKLGVLFIGLLIIGNAEVWGADWKFYGSTENYLAYYDAQNITRPSKNIVRVWVKWDYTEKGVIILVGKLGEKFYNLNNSINLIEINCLEKKFRNPSVIFHNNKGGVIYDLNDPSSEWNIFIPEVISESLYKEVCK
jgi:hypothetical protein